MNSSRHTFTNEPIFLKPVFHNTLWGGRRMENEYGYTLPEGPVGECWAISAHPHGDCTVEGGMWDGWHLSELWQNHRELFGNLKGDQFPLLVKILDARDDLSIQVHPNDSYAAEHENGSLGKRECWYVLAAHSGAHIVVGQHAKSRQEFAQKVSEGKWDELINEIPIKKGDFFQVEPGTVHAIMGATLVLETQQSSDITYRVYDYDRKQPDGSLRELHLQKALDVIDYTSKPPVSGEVKNPEVNGITHLVTTPSYTVERIRVAPNASVTMRQKWPFLCVSVVEGSGTVAVDDNVYQLPKGTHFILPANCGAASFVGSMTLVVSRVPPR